MSGDCRDEGVWGFDVFKNIITEDDVKVALVQPGCGALAEHDVREVLAFRRLLRSPNERRIDINAQDRADDPRGRNRDRSEAGPQIEQSTLIEGLSQLGIEQR